MVVELPTIGILLCSEKNEVVVEVALQDSAKPMGVAEYRLTEALPKDVREALPSLEELKEQVSRISGTVEGESQVTGKLRVKRSNGGGNG